MVGKAKRSPQEMKRNCTSEIITMVYNGSSLPVFIKMENIVSRKCTVSIHWTSIHFSFFSLSLSFPSFFFLFIRSFASCYTTMMNSNIYRRFYKYTRKIYSSLLHFYLRSLRPPRYLIFFLSYSSSSFFFF